MEMEELIDGVTGVLLAGGRSRRMGRDKRALELEGSSLLQRSLSVIGKLFSEVLVVTAAPEPGIVPPGSRQVTDLIPNCGSLGGLMTGLSHASHQRVFVAACDMPLLNPDVIRWLCQVDPEADVVIANPAQGIQPMHAVYSKQCLPWLESMAKEGRLKIQDIVGAQGLTVRVILDDEVRGRDPQGLSFLNVNTPADLEFARKLLSARGAGERSRG